MKNLYVLLILLIFLGSCQKSFENKDLYGLYVPIGYKNTFDTIRLTPGNVYLRTVYDKRHRIVSKMNGCWQVRDNSYIHFDSFFFNLDRDFIKYPNLADDNTGNLDVPLESSWGAIYFCTGYYQNENCYKKISD